MTKPVSTATRYVLDWLNPRADGSLPIILVEPCERSRIQAERKHAAFEADMDAQFERLRAKFGTGA